MHRFFVDKKINNTFVLNDKILKHLKVLRIDNEFFLCNYKKEFYKCKLKNNQAIIIEKLSINNEFQKEVVLAIALINFKNFEFVLQKATELGVTKIIPYISQYCNIDQKIAEKKVNRWNEIIKNAAEQSFRNIIPSLEKIIRFNELMEINFKNKFLAYENHEKYNEVLFFETDSIFAIGPEGGFSKTEISKAKHSNWQIVSLGKRILRAETAAFFVLSRVKD